MGMGWLLRSTISRPPLATCRPPTPRQWTTPRISSLYVPRTWYSTIISQSSFRAASPKSYVVRSLSRSTLRMLWHQRLGHINFRRLSEMHRFVKGMPKFTLPTKLVGCPICLADKLCKPPKGTETTTRARTCNQSLSIDFGFMVQKSSNSIRHNTQRQDVL
jgi:hypothetical protein